jgi:hypothetical protein
MVSTVVSSAPMDRPSPENLQHQIEQRLRTLRILWLGIFMSLVLFYVFSLVNKQPRDVEPNSTLTLIFIAVALLAIPLSFVVKSTLLKQSVEQQRPELVQQAYIVALAINEVGALLGLLDYFAYGDPYYFVPMIIAACGELLHFPRRQHVIDASFKTSTL